MTSKMTVEQVEETMQKGAIEAISELKEKTVPLLNELSKNELKRVITNVFDFPSPINVNAGIETEVIENIYALKDLQLQLSIQAIARVQEKKDKESENE